MIDVKYRYIVFDTTWQRYLSFRGTVVQLDDIGFTRWGWSDEYLEAFYFDNRVLAQRLLEKHAVSNARRTSVYVAHTDNKFQLIEVAVVPTRVEQMTIVLKGN